MLAARAGGIELAKLPIIDKSVMLANFERYNSLGIELNQALTVATAAERSRDFSAEIDGLTVGLSSGTSGQRGVFLISRNERAIWAGTILARLLSKKALRQVILPWARPLQIAFVLRADSKLYQQVRSQRVNFEFYDLLEPLGKNIAALVEQQPDLLVGPASVLGEFAQRKLRGELQISPTQVISVAEELYPGDAARIRLAFGIDAAQVYQATEGLLGFSCKYGSLHLNEQHVYVEFDWLDDARTRFQPIITDFSRSTQLMLRYRLDDVLHLATEPCRCHNLGLRLAGVDGRADAVLRFGDKQLFPDVLRCSMAIVSEHFRDWSVEQRLEDQEDSCLVVRLREPDVHATDVVQAEIDVLLASLTIPRQKLQFAPWQEPAPGAKLRRIRRTDLAARL